MRILWLCSTPALGAESVGGRPSEGGGWVGALEAAVKQHPEVELSISFPWTETDVRQVASGRHEYLPFPRFPPGGRLRRLLVDASCRLEPQSAVKHLERVVEVSRPDLIHVFGTEAFFGRVAEVTRLPVLIELQGLRAQCTAAYCAGLSKLDLLRFGLLKRLINGRSLLHQFYRYRRSAERERHVLASARFVVGRTDWDHLATGAMAPNATYYHCDRLLRSPFYDAEWRARAGAGKLQIISTLRGNPYKGIETVAQCCALLQELLPEGFEWTLVGIRPGEEVHRIVERKLRVSFERLGLRLPGRQPAQRVAHLLTQADIYVHPSRIDNSPNGLSEAMLVGLPVVSTNVGGIPSLVEHGTDGLLVPPGDPWAMAGAVRRLGEEPDLARRLGAAARARALGRHDPLRVSETMLSIYRAILSATDGNARTI